MNSLPESPDPDDLDAILASASQGDATRVQLPQSLRLELQLKRAAETMAQMKELPEDPTLVCLPNQDQPSSCMGLTAALVVGRSRQCGWAFPDRTRMSKKHFEMLWHQTIPHLRDLGSLNGTTLNGKICEPQMAYPLMDGDIIEGGGCCFLFLAGMPQ
jgi:hypothetical protein